MSSWFAVNTATRMFPMASQLRVNAKDLTAALRERTPLLLCPSLTHPSPLHWPPGCFSDRPYSSLEIVHRLLPYSSLSFPRNLYVSIRYFLKYLFLVSPSCSCLFEVANQCPHSTPPMPFTLLYFFPKCSSATNTLGNLLIIVSPPTGRLSPGRDFVNF